MTSPLHHKSSRAGFTLVEVMLASSILLLLFLFLVEGLIFALRTSALTRARLEADAYAFDRAWLFLNAEFPNEAAREASFTPSKECVPALYKNDWVAPSCAITVTTGSGDLYTATAQVAVVYGPAQNRTLLTRTIVRGKLGRAIKGK